MNNSDSCNCCPRGRNCAYAIGVAGSFLVIIALMWLTRAATSVAPLATARGAERMKIKSEFMAANAPLVEPNTYAWQDKEKGFVRVPIERAMELTLQEWKNPAAARSNLLSRADKFFYVPPAAPPKPSIYE